MCHGAHLPITSFETHIPKRLSTRRFKIITLITVPFQRLGANFQINIFDAVFAIIFYDFQYRFIFSKITAHQPLILHYPALDSVCPKTSAPPRLGGSHQPEPPRRGGAEIDRSDSFARQSVGRGGRSANVIAIPRLLTNSQELLIRL